MKSLLIFITIWSLTLASCKKTTFSGKTISEKITGKWRYAQAFYSIGGPLIYVSTESLRQWIEFKADGNFTSNMPRFENVTSYEMIDSFNIKFITPVQQPGFRLYSVCL